MKKKEFVEKILDYISDDTEIVFLVDGLDPERYIDHEYDSSSMSATDFNTLLIYLRRTK